VKRALRAATPEEPRPSGGASAFREPPAELRPFLEALAEAVAASIARDLERLPAADPDQDSTSAL